ncbi:unnamed protein product [Linum trigynum]
MKNECYLVRFRDQRDYDLASTSGPWLLGDTYLAVHRWFKGFNPWKSEIKSTIVWVQLPELPIEFVNAEAVMRIGGLIGTPIKYKVEGITYLIQYKGLDNICGECGMYRKSTAKCTCQIMTSDINAEECEQVPETQQPDPTNGRIYGEWMSVMRGNRRQQRRPENGSGHNAIHVKNAVHVLHEEMQDEVISIHATSEEGGEKEADKVNEMTNEKEGDKVGEKLGKSHATKEKEMLKKKGGERQKVDDGLKNGRSEGKKGGKQPAEVVTGVSPGGGANAGRDKNRIAKQKEGGGGSKSAQSEPSKQSGVHGGNAHTSSNKKNGKGAGNLSPLGHK